MAASTNRDGRSRDDELFTKVLSSAYSLQQQHDRIRLKLPGARFSVILEEVISTRGLIRNRKLDSDTAMQLIANRTEKLIGAAGAAIALLDGEILEYRVGTGIATHLCGFKTPAQEIVSFERLKSEPVAQMDAWQDKVLNRRVAANVLSAPVYRNGSLAGCLQLFSRHGHFDFDGRYICELMSSIVSQVIETVPLSPVPLRDERPANVPVDRASLRDNEHTSDSTTHAASSRAKLEWPGTHTRELEARLKKAAMSANAVDRAPKAVAAGESLKCSPPLARTSWQDPDSASREEKPIARGKHEEKDRNPQIVSRLTQGPSPSHGSLALVPPETHAPRLEPNPPAVNHEPVMDKTWDDEEDGRQPQRDVSRVVLVQESIPAAPSSHTADPKEDNAGIMTWKRISRMIYPIFVLLFAIGVRIRAGAHNWPLEVIIYILLVLTTLELQSRWSKR
jgi:hypothetical protein